MKKMILFGLCAAFAVSFAFGGELEDLFKSPPADAEPAASTDVSGDLYALKLKSDQECLDGNFSVTCNRAWPCADAFVAYVARCRALLRAGESPAKNEADFACTGTDTKVRYARRTFKDGTIGYFVAYPAEGARATVSLSFDVTGKYPELWDPSTGRIVQVARRDERDGRSFVSWDADPGATLFVMFRPRRSKAKKAKTVLDSRIQDATVKGTWSPAIVPGKTETGAVYRLKDGFVLSGDDPASVWLDLGACKGVVDVKVNGKAYPSLWKPPYRVDIVEALQFEADRHTIEPGASVGLQASANVELKVSGALGLPKVRIVCN